MEREYKMTPVESMRNLSLADIVALVIGEISNFSRYGGFNNELAFSLFKLITLCVAFILIKDANLKGVLDQLKRSLLDVYSELHALRVQLEDRREI
jgi:hypothetical protein